MSANNLTFQYALGSTEAEHERLIRQAAWLSAHTERLFREAGIGSGQRVLDLGSVDYDTNGESFIWCMDGIS